MLWLGTMKFVGCTVLGFPLSLLAFNIIPVLVFAVLAIERSLIWPEDFYVPSFQKVEDILRCLTVKCSVIGVGDVPYMWGQQNIIQFPQFVILRKGLNVKDI